MKEYSYVYLIGVGGIGMSAVARWFHAQSRQVFGYDQASTTLTDQLVQEGIQIHFKDRIEDIPTVVTCQKSKTIVVYTTAISPQNKILAYLKKNNYAIYKRSEILRVITQGHLTIAVAGTHGKTTTSALITHILYSARKNMVAFLGGIIKGYGSNLLTHGKISKDTVVVIEADEFDRFFLSLKPHWAIVTTVDPEHLDTYGDQKGLQEAFKTFIKLVPSTGHTIIHKKVSQQLYNNVHHPNITRYALTGAPVRAENVSITKGYFYFDYVSKELVIRNIRLAVPGYHNIENALAVITACIMLGLDADLIRKGMATFQGIKRRFEYIIRRENLIFLDDYAHHPVEISAVLKTVRAMYPDKKITVIFRPYLYTRTRDLVSGFAYSLDLADRVILLDIYTDREEPIEGVTSTCIFNKMMLQQKIMCDTAHLLDVLRRQDKSEILVTMGAGGIDNLIASIKDFLLTRWA